MEGIEFLKLTRLSLEENEFEQVIDNFEKTLALNKIDIKQLAKCTTKLNKS